MLQCIQNLNISHIRYLSYSNGFCSTILSFSLSHKKNLTHIWITVEFWLLNINEMITLHTFDHSEYYHRSGNFRVVKFSCFIFRAKFFLWSTIPMKIFWRYVPRLSDLEWDYACHNSKKHGIQTTCCVRGYHPAVGELHLLKNIVGTYCGSKDRQLIGHWAEVVTRLPWVTCGYRRRGCLAQNN